MQLHALDQQGKLIHATQAHKKQDYTCLECGSLVRTRSGLHRQAHYFHVLPNRDCKQHEKGMIHIQLQQFLLNLLPEGDCQLECRMPEINRIADVAWFSKRIVFEIQYSPISERELSQRNRDYAQAGWNVVWILHDHSFNQQRLSAAEDALRHWPHYYTNMDEEGQGMIYDQFDQIKHGFRFHKMAPLPVNLLGYSEMDKSKKQLNERAQHWPHYFEGDLTWLSWHKPDSSYLKHAQERNEIGAKPQTKTWYHYIANGYRFVFQMILERICNCL